MRSTQRKACVARGAHAAARCAICRPRSRRGRVRSHLTAMGATRLTPQPAIRKRTQQEQTLHWGGGGAPTRHGQLRPCGCGTARDNGDALRFGDMRLLTAAVARADCGRGVPARGGRRCEMAVRARASEQRVGALVGRGMLRLHPNMRADRARARLTRQGGGRLGWKGGRLWRGRITFEACPYLPMGPPPPSVRRTPVRGVGERREAALE